MLRNIPPIISADMMCTLMEMGHGDELCLGDANFPAFSNAERVVIADGHGVSELLDAILQFFPLDFCAPPVVLMAVMPGHDVKPTIWDEYRSIVKKHDVDGVFSDFEFVDRQAFYDRTKKCYAVVTTGERSLYGNVILKKGIVT